MSDTKNVWHRSTKAMGIETRELEDLTDFLSGRTASLTVEAVSRNYDNIGNGGRYGSQTLSQSIGEFSNDRKVRAWVEYKRYEDYTTNMERYENHRHAALKLASDYNVEFADIHGVLNNSGRYLGGIGYNWILLGNEYDKKSIHKTMIS